MHAPGGDQELDPLEITTFFEHAQIITISRMGEQYVNLSLKFGNRNSRRRAARNTWIISWYSKIQIVGHVPSGWEVFNCNKYPGLSVCVPLLCTTWLLMVVLHYFYNLLIWTRYYEDRIGVI